MSTNKSQNSDLPRHLGFLDQCLTIESSDSVEVELNVPTKYQKVKFTAINPKDPVYLLPRSTKVFALFKFQSRQSPAEHIRFKNKLTNIVKDIGFSEWLDPKKLQSCTRCNEIKMTPRYTLKVIQCNRCFGSNISKNNVKIYDSISISLVGMGRRFLSVRSGNELPIVKKATPFFPINLTTYAGILSQENYRVSSEIGLVFHVRELGKLNVSILPTTFNIPPVRNGVYKLASWNNTIGVEWYSLFHNGLWYTPKHSIAEAAEAIYPENMNKPIAVRNDSFYTHELFSGWYGLTTNPYLDDYEECIPVPTEFT